MIEDMRDFIREQVGLKRLFTSETVWEYGKGIDVVVYGVAKMYVPLDENRGMMVRAVLIKPIREIRQVYRS